MKDKEMKPNVRVRRLVTSCCGMKLGEVYPAVIEDGYYCRVLLPDGKWTDSHRFSGWFQVVDGEMPTPPKDPA